MHALTAILVLGVLLLCGLRQMRKRTSIAVYAEPEFQVAPPNLTLGYDNLLADPDQANAVHSSPISPASVQSGALRYVLEAPQHGRAEDRVGALLDIMSGPGICTPRGT
ncbi:hypothetical protein [Sphingomonas sp. TREG-RG-20F-R18-01]|uniref:hypothetical protein n=1 Tax=Sphingomonas sp. TREG-RG-20F-R18-01 TaxID=2914982 RepID=UPI001F5A2639|nr:hypothetical protein [Sphingomonas sp. TREG-RG-20F-R18-01]